MDAAELENFRPENFTQDRPRPIASPTRITEGTTIDGVVLARLGANTDRRGTLIELLTTRDEAIEPIVHVYQVIAAAGSIRAWVYHKWQNDRLHFTLGDFEVRLLDIRPDSAKRGELMVLRLGHNMPCRLTIPPLVAHSVRNLGDSAAAFVNMPTRIYDPANPDKFRYEGSVKGFDPRDA
jgi:dTDP-4-dehydrorhamnose 3,5-epimerase